MHIVYGLTLLVQIAFAIHVVKTGREFFWIYIIMLFPGIGIIVYLVTQVLPDAKHDRRVKSAGRQIKQTLDPLGEVRRLRDQLELADNLDNRLALADACVAAKLWEDAEPLYQNCLSGPYRHDPHILLKLATAQFHRTQFAAARETLERLVETNPDFQSPDGHLLYARTLVATDAVEQAKKEYVVLSESFPGEEARIRYGLLLLEQGDREGARQQFSQTLKRVKRAPKYYRQKEKHWIKLARENLNR